MSPTTIKGTVNGLRGEVRMVEGTPKKGQKTKRAVCLIKNDDSFVFGRTYRVTLLPLGRLAVKDEYGKTTICDAEDFKV